MNPKMNCTSNISKYYFFYFPLTFMRCLHITGNTTNGKGKVRTRMSQVYRTTNKSTIQGGIYFMGSTSGRNFDSRLEGRRGWFTIFHVKGTKKVTSILRLGKKRFLLCFARLGDQENNANVLSLTFQNFA